MVTSPHGSRRPDLGKLAVLAGVREFPTRIKCASLAWHAVQRRARRRPGRPVSTE